MKVLFLPLIIYLLLTYLGCTTRTYPTGVYIGNGTSTPKDTFITIYKCDFDTMSNEWSFSPSQYSNGDISEIILRNGFLYLQTKSVLNLQSAYATFDYKKYIMQQSSYSKIYITIKFNSFIMRDLGMHGGSSYLKIKLFQYELQLKGDPYFGYSSNQIKMDYDVKNNILIVYNDNQKLESYYYTWKYYSGTLFDYKIIIGSLSQRGNDISPDVQGSNLTSVDSLQIDLRK